MEAANAQMVNRASFRDACKNLVQEFAEGRFRPNKKAHYALQGFLGNLVLQEIREKWSVLAAISKF